MLKKISNYDEVEKWLNILIQERISKEISLRLNKDKNKWIIRSKKYKNLISILIDDYFYSIGYQSDLSCIYINLENNYFDSKYKRLPAPSYHSDSHFNIFKNGSSFDLNFDILGFAFWMMNRSEEISLESQYYDIHNRFDYRFSHAYKFGYLSRPIIDEWLKFLSQLIKFNYPSTKIKKFKFRISPTHDVDNPRKYSLISKKRIIKNFLYSFIKNPFAEIKYLSLLNRKIKDPYDNFDWILKISDKYKLKNEFFFMTNSTNWRYDPGYKIKNPHIIDLLKKIHKKGHRIGLHPSYNSTSSQKVFLKEVEIFKKIISKNNLNQKSIGVRMHYLKFIIPYTARKIIDFGFEYDSSIGYANFPGFRCGTCRDFLLFDSLENKILTIREKPLLFMESNLLKEKYDKNSTKKLFEKIYFLKKKCFEVDGEFVFLWHNCNLETEKNKTLYEFLASPI